MDFDIKEVTLLNRNQVFGDKIISPIKDLGTKCPLTDFAKVLGASVSFVDVDYNEFDIAYDRCTKGRTGRYCLSSGNIDGVDGNGHTFYGYSDERNYGVRPALIFSIPDEEIKKNGIPSSMEYGEYPQYAVSKYMASELERAYQSGKIEKTGKTYTSDSSRGNTSPFNAKKHEEYKYDGKKYVRIMYKNKGNYKLADGDVYEEGDYVWIEVSPIEWHIDSAAKIMVSDRLLVSGIRFCSNREYNGNFKTTEMYNFLNTYFAKEIIQSQTKNKTMEKFGEIKDFETEMQKRYNPYKLNFEQVREEDIIKGAIESGVAVFLHGASSEGKSARVKQIDPDCVIIYLRNATPDSLNGKSVYNAQKGEMIDVKPTWLKKLEAKCDSEPDKLHIVFFDELTNALPSIQGIAFNIILDKEVNGMWKLPKNACIVAAGNEMNDSLSANQLAEPLFNRFAHVYIKTTTKDWLKWASEHNIHPAIYAYIAYKKGETLRSKYNGEKPNADPRKWEMASKMLYATGNPEMLRALVGEDITKEFVEFCREYVITLDDVINRNYDDHYVESLPTASKYATTVALTQVDEENMVKVRNFVSNLGAEFRAMFDSLWTHGDEKRLELIAEEQLTDLGGRKI